MYVKGQRKHNKRQGYDGFGLIEVMIAIAVIAGAALLVSQFVTSQTKQQIQVRGSSDCEAGLAAILAKIKESDNNTQIISWLPTTQSLTHPQVSRDIATGYNDGNVGEILSPESVSQVMPANFNAAELALAREANNYQLISSASTFIASYYPSYCTPTEVTSSSDYLGSIVENFIDRSYTKVQAKVNLVNLSSGADEACGPVWHPVPVNRSAHASTNTNQGLRLTLTAEYDDPNGEKRSCTASATFSPGSDLSPPEVTSSLSIVGADPNHFVTDGGNSIYCGDTSSIPTLAVSVSQGAATPEAGVLYFCKLDYHAGRGAGVNRTRGTGWFLCSMPEGSINAVNVAATTNLSVVPSSVEVTQGVNSSISFQITNIVEGTYILHTKSVDTARNESAVDSQTIRVDLTRPQFAAAAYDHPFAPSTVNGLEAYRFQCDAPRAHSQWTTHLQSGIEVTTQWQEHHYYNGSSLLGSINCSRPAPSLPVYTRYEPGQMNVTNTEWLSDGPKTAEFVACDICSRVLLDPNPSRAEALWFVDATDAEIAASDVNLNASPHFEYDAGVNSANPYVLTHKALNSPGLTSSTSSLTPRLVRNSYSGRTIANPATVTFPLQTAINACESYGTYQYVIEGGCSDRPGRSTTTINKKYTSTRSSSGLSPGYGIPFNTLYCPTFEDIKLGATPPTFMAGTCASIGRVDCNTSFAGGYSGDRSSIPSCTFYPEINRSCKFPTCPRPGGGVPLEVGQSINMAATSNPAQCGPGCSWEERRCVWNGTNSVLTGSYTATTCTEPAPCPTDCPSDSVGVGGLGGAFFASESSCNADPSTDGCSLVSPPGVNSWCGAPAPPGEVCPAGKVACSPPEAGCVEESPGLYCKPVTCSNPTYSWVWPSARPNDGSCKASCAPGETQQNSYTQFCQNGLGSEEAGCCEVGSPETCVTCTTDPVVGKCGSADGGNFTTAPTSGLCDTTTESATVGGTGPWSWTCKGSNHPTNSQSCSANLRENGQCGAANGGSFLNPPTSLCAKGTAVPSGLSGYGPWSWTCQGVNGGTSASCSANKSCLFHTQTSWWVGGLECRVYIGEQIVFPHGQCIPLAATTSPNSGTATACCNQGNHEWSDETCKHGELE